MLPARHTICWHPCLRSRWKAPSRPCALLAEELGLSAGQLFGILRVAVTGQKVSPPLFESMAIIGKEKVLERVKAAIVAVREYVIRCWN